MKLSSHSKIGNKISSTLSLDITFAPYLSDDFRWKKKSKGEPYLGFRDDTAGDNRLTAVQKNATLELLLGQIANFCPILSRNTIVKNTTCFKDVWSAIRLHYDFQISGSQFLDIANIKESYEEKPEDLFQRLMTSIEDNLLTIGGGISHHGELPTEDEELSPTLANFIVLQWLKLLHNDLPQLVKQNMHQSYVPKL